MEETLLILKPDTFWRRLDRVVEERLAATGVEQVASVILRGNQNLSEEEWREFYFPAIGSKPAILSGTSKYMAYGPIKVFHLRGAGVIAIIRRWVGVTRPWQADAGTIRGDFWAGAEETNAPFRRLFEQPGDSSFLFNMVHASDSAESFEREIVFFRRQLNGGV